MRGGDLLALSLWLPDCSQGDTLGVRYKPVNIPGLTKSERPNRARQTSVIFFFFFITLQSRVE